MHKHRFYISPQNIVNNKALITQPEYHHIVDVLRYKEGDNIILFDGKGSEYIGRVTFINKKIKSVEVYVEKAERENVPRPLILVQSLVRSMDVIIQKATELGVTHIYPVVTRNSVVKVQPAKIDRWRRILEEACKQCKRSWFPYIDKIWDLEEAISALDWVGEKIICTPSGKTKSLKEIPDRNPGSVAIMIGPEGDFTRKELELAFSKGWIPVHLGKTILRAETAAISVLGAVCYKFGFWD